MRELDKIIKRGRKTHYKKMRKLFKARDAASKYVSRTVKVKDVRDFFPNDITDYHSTAYIAKQIVDRDGKMFIPRPPAPPLQRRKTK